jgi:hypothetical protein
MAEAKKTYTTKAGRKLTDAEIETLADEAARGYDVEQLKSRRRGRPMLVTDRRRSCRCGWIRT